MSFYKQHWYGVTLFKHPNNLRSFLPSSGQARQRGLCLSSVLMKKSTVKKVKEMMNEDDDDISDAALDTTSIMMRLRGGIKEHGENVFIIQPDYKWGKHRHLTKLVQPRLDEAKGLVETISNWKVADSAIASVHDDNPVVFFGTGKVAELGNEIHRLRKEKGITSVFLNTSALTSKQHKALEEIWHCRILDRYRVVLEIFKARATTKEAKLQVKLAEIQYLRSHLAHTEHGKYDHQRGGIMSMGGGGETQFDKDKQKLLQVETKVKRALKIVKEQRDQKRTRRLHANFPVVAVIGYTNAGKTSLARGLARDFSIEGEDKLFATLDTTVHRGKLPSNLPVLYIDTVGFISELPHELVASFSATLEDVKNADLLLHVRDVTHPEFELQNETVLKVCRSLNMREELLNNMIFVDNKLDLSPKWSYYLSKIEEERKNYPRYNTNTTVGVSAVHYVGLYNLRNLVQKKIFEVTQKEVTKLTVPGDGEELRWLHHEATVLETVVNENGTFTLDVVTDPQILGKYKKRFGEELPTS